MTLNNDRRWSTIFSQTANIFFVILLFKWNTSMMALHKPIWCKHGLFLLN